LKKSLWNGNDSSLPYLLKAWGKKAIAKIMSITNGTLRQYILIITKAFGVHSTLELLLMLDTTGLSDAPAVRLTPRGKEVLRLLLTGMTNRRIGECMGISLSGVRRHREKMLQQNGCESMLELIARYHARHADGRNVDQCKRSRGSALYTVNPGQVGFTTMQESLHGIDKDRIYPLTLQATGLTQTEDAFNKTVTLVNASPKTALAPQHGISQGAFRMIVGRRHPFFFQEEPKAIQFSAQ
jgi:DNA-binding CsgD family transcriptional regulator